MKNLIKFQNTKLQFSDYENNFYNKKHKVKIYFLSTSNTKILLDGFRKNQRKNLLAKERLHNSTTFGEKIEAFR